MQLKKFFIGVVCLLLTFTGTTFAQQNVQKGGASYYGPGFHGKRSSNGEVFNMHAMTCAHRTLPFGTTLLVRDTKTNKEVVVRVTDRGPFCRGRIIDLSYGAAKKLGMVARGTAQVEIKVLPKGVLPETLKLLEDPTEKMPEVEYYDPKSGNYYAWNVWAERAQVAHEEAKQEAAAKKREQEIAKAKAAKPRWHILNDKLTAKADVQKK